MWIVTYVDNNNVTIEEHFDDVYAASQFMIAALKLYNNVRSFKETFNRGE